MDLTELLMKLAEVTGVEVYQDMCTNEDADRYITYIYQDERPALCGNNKVLADQCDIYVNLYTPVNFDYFGVKKTVRNYLETSEFTVISVGTGLEDTPSGGKIRRTTFDCRYAGFRE